MRDRFESAHSAPPKKKNDFTFLINIYYYIEIIDFYENRYASIAQMVEHRTEASNGLVRFQFEALFIYRLSNT